MISPPKNIGLLAGLILSLLPAFLPTPADAAPQIKPSAQTTVSHPVKRLLMAHYMPWFTAKPYSPQWGWHWTMNHYNPDHLVNGRREAPSHYYPLIGLYDSNDPDALQCQALLMKLAGIDGVIFDWYGHDETQDYGINNRNTERMIPILRQAGLRYAICYETQTVPSELKSGFIPAGDALGHGKRLLGWMQQHFFSSPDYVTLDNRPVLLSFGDPYYDDAQWNQIFAGMQPRPLYFTENDKREATASVGGFDWPAPKGGTAAAMMEQDKFYGRAQSWPFFIAAAFPRFDDIYSQAGVGKSYGHIDDRDGRTYEDTLTKALQSRAPIVQLVTWNDWGEGTQIEPSVEVGCRDLETTQRLRRKYLDSSFSGTGRDLRLPIQWYLLRKKYAADPAASAKLAAFFPLVVAGRMEQAQALLRKYEKP